MQQLDYLVLLIFTLVVVMAGLSFGRRGATMTSFFAAGGALPWPVSGLSLFMSFFSAGTFVVWGSIAYEYGMVAMTIQWTMCLAGLIIGLFIASRWRKTGVLTVAEFVEARLGYRVQRFYTLLFLLFSIVGAGAFLYPVAVIVDVATGLGVREVAIGLGLVIILYTAVGGLWAVVVTDVLQFVILTAAVLIVVPLALGQSGGFDGFVNQAPDGFFDLVSGEYTVGFLIAYTLYNTLFIGGNWAYVQRYTSVRTPREARKVGFLFSALYVVSPLVWMLPPMIYRVIHPELTGLENEGAYLMMVREVLPVGLLGMMLGGIVFATASSVNTTLNLAAAVVTNDVYQKIWPNRTDRQLMTMARASTVFLGIVTIAIALLVPVAGGIVEVVLSVGAVAGAPLFAPPIWVLFSNRQTGRSVYVISLLSLFINLWFKFGAPLVWGWGLERGPEMILGVGSTLGLLAVYELWAWSRGWTDPASRAVELSRQSAVKPTRDEEEASSGANRFGLRVIAIALAVTGLMMGGLSLVAGEAAIWVATMSFLILGIAFWIVRRGGQRESRS
ncbi:MAG: sodium:solute symporter family protein [Bacteroidota bacterium]